MSKSKLTPMQAFNGLLANVNSSYPDYLKQKNTAEDAIKALEIIGNKWVDVWYLFSIDFDWVMYKIDYEGYDKSLRLTKKEFSLLKKVLHSKDLYPFMVEERTEKGENNEIH